MGFLLLFLIVPTCLVGATKPETLRYTSGLIIPLSLLVFLCLLSGRHKVSELMQQWQALALSASILIVAVCLHASIGLAYALSLYFSAFVYFCLTNLFHNVLVLLGWYVPPEGELWK